jgi:two-component system NtrC family sensor kinase
MKLDLREHVPVVRGSADKLKQVFLNLILNARDAMPDGGLIRIVTAEEDGLVRISISDSGVGIPKENLDRIFDAFFTTKSKVSGVGLGLSVSYGIIGQHRGTISVTSTVGEGSTFVISLPTHTQETSAVPA